MIGFLLGPTFETQLRKTSLITGDDPIGFFMTRPASQVIAGLLVIVLALPLFRAWQRKRTASKESVEN